MERRRLRLRRLQEEEVGAAERKATAGAVEEAAGDIMVEGWRRCSGDGRGGFAPYQFWLWVEMECGLDGYLTHGIPIPHVSERGYGRLRGRWPFFCFPSKTRNGVVWGWTRPSNRAEPKYRNDRPN